MTLTHYLRRARRHYRCCAIVTPSLWQIMSRRARGGAFVFRDAPTRLVVMYARGRLGPELVEAAGEELLLRFRRRARLNGWNHAYLLDEEAA